MRYHFVLSLLLGMVSMIPAHGQQATQIDLRTQSKNVNFSGASSTRPFKSGTSLPATCNVSEMFFKSDAPAGSNLYACTSANVWTLQAAGSGGSGSSGISDLSVAETTNTVLTIGSTCSTSHPCNVRFGNLVYTVIQPATATVAAGTGTAYIYFTGDGNLTVGHSMTVACASCLSLSGITSFPADSIPIATWTASNGSWVSGGGVDLRAFQSTKSVVAGVGLAGTFSAGQTTLGIDTTLVGLLVQAPSASNSTCTPGSWSMDNSYFYLCVSADAWRRAALSSW